MKKGTIFSMFIRFASLFHCYYCLSCNYVILNINKGVQINFSVI